MKVYIVTDGCYSDYHIVAVFLEKEKAELYVNTHDFDRASMFGSDMSIVEYDTQDDTIEGEIAKMKYVYSFEIDEIGRISDNCRVWELNGEESGTPVLNGKAYYICFTDEDRKAYYTLCKNDVFKIVLDYLDVKKATKVAQDMWAQFHYQAMEDGTWNYPRKKAGYTMPEIKVSAMTCTIF